MIELIKPFGFNSWLELYKILVASNLSGEKEIRIQRIQYKQSDATGARSKVTDDLPLEVEYIKARAFDELISQFPGFLLSDIIGQNQPWPLFDVLKKLIEASEILLNKKSYDGHGWEEIKHATDRARQITNLYNP